MARVRETAALVIASGSAAGADRRRGLRVRDAASRRWPVLEPILSVLPGQLFASALARAKGLDPDRAGAPEQGDARPVTHRVGILGAGRIARLHGLNLGARVPRLRVGRRGRSRVAARPPRWPASSAATPHEDWRELVARPGRRRGRRSARRRRSTRSRSRRARRRGSTCSARSRSPSTWPARTARVEAAEAAGIVLQVGYNRRFDRSFAAVRAAVAGGRVGRPVIVRVTSRDPEPAPRALLERIPGLFIDTTSHDLDMVRFVTGARDRRGERPRRRRSSRRTRASWASSTRRSRRSCWRAAPIAAIDNCWRSAVRLRPAAGGARHRGHGERRQRAAGHDRRRRRRRASTRRRCRTSSSTATRRRTCGSWRRSPTRWRARRCRSTAATAGPRWPRRWRRRSSSVEGPGRPPRRARVAAPPRAGHRP